ncbi:MAG: hypothetical protein JW902_06770 [Syntrophaceae bacterium]|nr:hypothetical protein [Syntrophaceae bacterium]
MFTSNLSAGWSSYGAVLLPILFLICSGCANKDVPFSDPAGTSGAVSDEVDYAAGWTVRWRGTADMYYEKTLGNWEWKNDVPCFVQITSWEPNHVYFDMQDPYSLRFFTTVDSDTIMTVSDLVGSTRCEAYKTRYQ